MVIKQAFSGRELAPSSNDEAPLATENQIKLRRRLSKVKNKSLDLFYQAHCRLIENRRLERDHPTTLLDLISAFVRYCGIELFPTRYQLWWYSDNTCLT